MVAQKLSDEREKISLHGPKYIKIAFIRRKGEGRGFQYTLFFSEGIYNEFTLVVIVS